LQASFPVVAAFPCLYANSLPLSHLSTEDAVRELAGIGAPQVLVHLENKSSRRANQAGGRTYSSTGSAGGADGLPIVGGRRWPLGPVGIVTDA
jgi:hypothetical protein